MYHGEREDAGRGTYSRFRGKLADCRECKLSSKCMQNPVTSRGRQIQVDSERGAEKYGKRMWIIEPVFGNIASNIGWDKLSLRGKDKVTGQGTLYALVHNIGKYWRYGMDKSMAV